MTPDMITRCPNCQSEYRTATVLKSQRMHSADKWWNTCPNADCQAVIEVAIRPMTQYDRTRIRDANRQAYEAAVA